jgi:hypothetical protein
MKGKNASIRRAGKGSIFVVRMELYQENRKSPAIIGFLAADGGFFKVTMYRYTSMTTVQLKRSVMTLTATSTS